MRTESGWREKLVDVDDSPAAQHAFRFVLAPTPTPASRALVPEDAGAGRPPFAGPDGAARGPRDDATADTLEVSPGALAFVDDVARRVAASRGAALFVDYGYSSGAAGDTLRGFRRHKQVSPLLEPGLVDLTVDADFGACGLQATAPSTTGRPRPLAFGAATQGDWLTRMGIVPRLEALLNLDDITERQVEDLISACERLLDPEQMGERYKVLSLVDATDDDDAPPAGYLDADRVRPPTAPPIEFDTFDPADTHPPPPTSRP